MASKIIANYISLKNYCSYNKNMVTLSMGEYVVGSVVVRRPGLWPGRKGCMKRRESLISRRRKWRWWHRNSRSRHTNSLLVHFPSSSDTSHRVFCSPLVSSFYSSSASNHIPFQVRLRLWPLQFFLVLIGIQDTLSPKSIAQYLNKKLLVVYY